MADDRYQLTPIFDKRHDNEGYWDIHVPIPGTEQEDGRYQAVETQAFGNEDYASEVATDLADQVHDDPKRYLGEEQ